MTFKIEISQFYDKSEPKHWKWNKIRHFFMWHSQFWYHILFYQQILKYFNVFPNQNISVLWLKWTQAMEMKQNQTFFHGTYSNLTSIFTGRQILKYFNNFYNLHFLISLQKWAQTSKKK